MAWFAVFAVLASGYLSRETSRAIAASTAREIVNRKAAIVFRNVRVLTPKIFAGGTVEISYGYDKRDACTPPAGYGDYYFRAYQRDPDGRYIKSWPVEPSLASIESAGSNRTSALAIDVGNLAPGTYRLRLRPVLQCEGESGPQFLEPIFIPFEILDPPSASASGGGFLP